MSPAELFYSLVTFLPITFLCVVAVTHILSRLKFRPKELKLSPDSIIVITGGCMGIGKLMAIQLARLYHSTIIIIDRRTDLFQAVSSEINKHNGICECLFCDLSDPTSVHRVLQQVKKSYKHINFLLYNAGVFFPNLCWKSSDQELRVTMDVNFFSPVKMVKQLLGELEGGHIGVIASFTSISDGFQQISAYVASKHAVLAYFNSLRQEFKAYSRPITVSVACPYAINTTMFQGFKTKLSAVLPVLDQKYVAKRVIRQFVAKKEVCFIGRRHAWIAILLNFFPTFVRDSLNNRINQCMFQRKEVRGSIGDVRKD